MSYLSSLKLAQEPFSTSPDPSFFYRSAGHITALNKLEIAVRLGRGLSVILGDVGTGKTTLCRTLIRNFDGSNPHDNDFIFHIMLDPSFRDEEDFYEQLLKIFGVSTNSRSSVEAREAIQQYLFKKTIDEQKTVVLIIDEGQKLKIEHLEILRTLLNYETNEQKMLQLIIFAQLELLPRMENIRNFTDRISLKYMLRPLDETETAKMIEFRLRRAGHTEPAAIFTPEAVNKIYEYTGGYPRQITKLCHNAIELLIMGDLQQVGVEIIDEVIRQDRDWKING